MTKKKGKSIKSSKKEKNPEGSKKLRVLEKRMTWNPMEMMRRLDEEFENFRRDVERNVFGSSFMAKPRHFRWNEIQFPEIKEPLMDIKDTGKELVIEAEMPGIPKENIDIQVTENSIEVCGEIEKKEDDEKEGYYRQERSYSRCYRQMPLPEKIIPTKADAKLENGILKITLPKKTPRPEPKSHKLKVK